MLALEFREQFLVFLVTFSFLCSNAIIQIIEFYFDLFFFFEQVGRNIGSSFGFGVFEAGKEENGFGLFGEVESEVFAALDGVGDLPAF